MEKTAGFCKITAVQAFVDDVKKVLLAWGPGKFDAELFLDGQGFRPASLQVNSVANGTPPMSAATLIPPACGLAGFDLHTWTGWGSVTYWNAFVANLERPPPLVLVQREMAFPSRTMSYDTTLGFGPPMDPNSMRYFK